uniref:Holin n=1 Tax=viral metagenome TaxID=1070528 RepID=A0A6M3XVT0_9ZZZZ
MQISKAFCPETLAKVKRSALIALGGFVVSALPMLLPDILNALAGRPMLAAFIGAGATFLVNTVREYLKGKD